MVHPTFNFLNQISRYFKFQFFQNMHSRATSEYTKVSFNIFVKFTQKYTSTASLNFNFFNFVRKWNYWNSISASFWFSWLPIWGDFAQKKSGYIEWYLVFFCDIWTFFCQIKLRLEISQKKVQISKKKSRYHFLFWTSVPYFGIKRGYQY